MATIADLGRPAHEQGVTILTAATTYRQPVGLIRRCYVAGRDESKAPIGRRDAWGVWFADPIALRNLLEGKAADPTRSASQARTADKIFRLRARLEFCEPLKGGVSHGA